ncbi:MAG: hypothetical protein LC620_06710, partial [Halobacteriales archaeon]|nr:hypothetical protein [Halobacteriales archaeon]
IDAKQAAFHAAHPLLNATDDVDGDGTPNWSDTDLDGNGVDDAAQSGPFKVTKSFGDKSPAPPTTTYTKDFTLYLGTGNQGVHAWLNWSVTVPLPQLPSAPNFSVTIVHGDDAFSSGPAVANGASRSLPVDVPADQVPGNYTVRVTMTQAGPATDFGVLAVIDYGPAKATEAVPDK